MRSLTVFPVLGEEVKKGAFLVGNDRSLHAAYRDSWRSFACCRDDSGELFVGIAGCKHGTGDERTNDVD